MRNNPPLSSRCFNIITVREALVAPVPQMELRVELKKTYVTDCKSILGMFGHLNVQIYAYYDANEDPLAINVTVLPKPESPPSVYTTPTEWTSGYQSNLDIRVPFLSISHDEVPSTVFYEVDKFALPNGVRLVEESQGKRFVWETG